MDSQGRLLSYDRVIANPPFSLKNWGREFAPGDPNHRFDRYGTIPPKTRGDLAFLLHHDEQDVEVADAQDLLQPPPQPSTTAAHMLAG